MPDNFRLLHDEWAARLPQDLEHELLQQVNNYSVFGSVVELFVPNALHTAARLMGGDGAPGQYGGGRTGMTDPMEWRLKPR